MRISVSTIASITLILILLFLAIQAFSVFSEKEGFVDSEEPPQQVTSTGIVMTSCPVDSESFIDSYGRTLCCLGKVVENKCQGQIVCSLSESSGGMPTCTEWQLATMKERGTTRCPTSMPFYFESPDGTKGCTAGPINRTGTGPLNDTVKMCKKYSTLDDDRKKLDSCTNAQKIQEFLNTLG
jgi:hypothetical protein